MAQMLAVLRDWPDVSLGHVYARMAGCMVRCWSIWLRMSRYSDGRRQLWPSKSGSDAIVGATESWKGIGAGEGIRTLDHLLGRHIALSGVAALMARGAKAVQLSSRETAL